MTVMFVSDYVAEVTGIIAECKSFDEIREILPTATRGLGFDYYAVSRHPGVRKDDFGEPIHNYPAGWEARYISGELGRCDPVHRACHVRTSGFRWRDAHLIVPFSPRDDAMLDEARGYGIEDGFTVPANVYGAARGSVTFATEIGTPFPEHRLFLAQAFGNILFQKMLDIGWARHLPKRDILTERQLECVMWVGRGKCNWAIAKLLGLSVNTVKKHLREACERYAFATRTTLPLQALADGSLCISDVLS